MTGVPGVRLRGHFAELVCINGHDRCYLGPDERCPYCERLCRICRNTRDGGTPNKLPPSNS
jgi:hypothetical protein